MSAVETVWIGQGGDVAIPPSLRQLTGIEAGSAVTLEAHDGTIVIRPIERNFESYTAERKAEFLLSNAIGAADYAAACDEVRRMGLDPEEILHDRPDGA